MTAIHETAYPRLKPNPTEAELQQNFTPTKVEIGFMDQHTRINSLHTRFGFMLSLKCHQCLGYHLPLNTVPKAIVEFVASRMNISAYKSKLKAYMKSKRRKHHRALICKFLEISQSRQQRKAIIKRAAIKSATTKDSVADIINDIIEELVKERFELPSFNTLNRAARAARALVSSKLYEAISCQLTDDIRDVFETLFLTEQNTFAGFSSGWEYLKQEVKKPTSQNIRAFTDYLEQLRIWKAKNAIDLSDIPEHRLEQYVAEAMALDIADMRKIKESKRYALTAILLYHQYAKSLDSIVLVLTRWLRRMHVDAKLALDKHHNDNRRTTDELIGDLKKVLLAAKQNSTDIQERLSIIEDSLPSNIDASIEACDQHLQYADDNYLPFLLKLYSNSKRHTIFRLLKQITVCSASKNKLIEEAVEAVLFYQGSRSDQVDLCLYDLNDFNWLDDQWFEHVTGSPNRSEVTMIVNKRYFELAVFNLIMNEVGCADAFVVDSYANDDPNKQLITWETFFQELEPYSALIGKPAKPREFVEQLQKEHSLAARQANQGFSKNEQLSIINGEPIVKREKSKSLTQAQEKFSHTVASKMPLTDIVSVLMDVERWLNLSRPLNALSGHDAKIRDYDLRFVATCFAYGCNVGPTQAERCLKKYSRKQIAWIFNHHMTEKRLNKINEAILKSYQKFELPYIWGNGESASVDGTYWDMYTNNLLAEHHIRYGKYGGVGYYHVSDQYIALFGNFIPCGVYEATYIFDGIYALDEELRPETIHGDSHAQNEVVFGFAYLLAITLMPRIRSFKHLKFYRPAGINNREYQHIHELFTTNEPNWKLIESMYHDMLRVVMSIQNGKIKASIILKKLCSKSKKNKLHQAFRELGRVVRTTFLLNYISDVELRRKIQAATCKSEEFNDFVDWITFGKDSTIQENKGLGQRKFIALSTMVANAMMFHTVANMTEALNDISNQGLSFTRDELSVLSAYFRENVNRYGAFDLSRPEKTRPLNFNIHKA